MYCNLISGVKEPFKLHILKGYTSIFYFILPLSINIIYIHACIFCNRLSLIRIVWSVGGWSQTQLALRQEAGYTHRQVATSSQDHTGSYISHNAFNSLLFRP